MCMLQMRFSLQNYNKVTVQTVERQTSQLVLNIFLEEEGQICIFQLKLRFTSLLQTWISMLQILHYFTKFSLEMRNKCYIQKCELAFSVYWLSLFSVDDMTWPSTASSLSEKGQHHPIQQKTFLISLKKHNIYISLLYHIFCTLFHVSTQ